VYFDELNLGLQRVHEWAAANGLKLNLIKNLIIVISRCRVDIPSPMLLIGSDVIKDLRRLITLRRCVRRY
jgi:hypothetical protein